MRTDSQKVQERDKCPMQPGDICCHCKQPVGEEHASNCVCRKRTIVIVATIQYVTKVPDFWDEGQIEFFFNESRWCASNILPPLETGPDCLCPFTEIKYVREATEEDEEDWFGLTEGVA